MPNNCATQLASRSARVRGESELEVVLVPVTPRAPSRLLAPLQLFQVPQCEFFGGITDYLIATARLTQRERV